MNLLSKETSPYLLQHANNPVNWFAWSNEAWEKAQQENKLVLVSIGYSACHWCHVMEREVFENDDAARFMNEHFICIKVDREERPDVDHVYMLAVQLMTQSGGWPLNCFCLPDGRPVYGGTYFPLDRWMGILEKLIDIQRREYPKLIEYAAALSEGITQTDSGIDQVTGEHIDPALADELVEQWKKNWDTEKGGSRRAPKFPMPNNLQFLLHYAVLKNRPDVSLHVHLTLRKMAQGGIYDQVGGGFARYSVDGDWKVPHFEKMLYDNAQLVSIYSEAYRSNPNPLYKRVVEETLAFIRRELTTPEGLFYSALDADSEGVEGKFYTWTEEELESVLKEDYPWARKYFSVGKEGYWEDGQNILLCSSDDEDIILDEGSDRSSFDISLLRIKSQLLEARSRRIRPGLDDKALASWNALMIKGYTDAFKAFGNEEYKQAAVSASGSFLQHFVRGEGTLWHTFTKGVPAIEGFLEDYAFAMEAFICLHEITSDEKWIIQAKLWADIVHEQFGDRSNGLYWFTSEKTHDLFTRKKEIEDNVIPSANSTLCKSFFLLSRILENEDLEKKSKEMLLAVLPRMNYAAGYSNWLIAVLWHSAPFNEIIATGPGAQKEIISINRSFIPNTLAMASTTERSLPLFRNRIGTTTALYVCTGKTCLAPMDSARDVLAHLNQI